MRFVMPSFLAVVDVIAHDLGREHLNEALRALQGRRDHRHLQA